MNTGATNGSHKGFVSILASLLALEALYNPPGQQRGGMLRAVRKGLPRQDKDHPVLNELAQGPCNTNPILSGYIGGMLVREARASALGDAVDFRGLIERCRSLLAPLLAAAGDNLFWGHVRPALSVAALFSAICCRFEPAILYCVGYNVTQMWWRRRALAIGFLGEQAVRQELRGGRLDKASALWGSIGRVMLGTLAGAVIVEGWSRMGPAGALLPLVTGLAGSGLAAARKTGPLISAALGLAAACACSVIAAVL